MSHSLRRGLVFAACCLGAAAALPLLGRADDAPKGRQYALLVGVRNYKRDELRRLEYTENDVTELAQVLRDAGYKRVVLMTQAEAVAQGDNDLEPTGKNIRRQLRSLLEDRQAEDGVLIAFSGHGVQPTKKGSYFCPMDAEVTDPTTLVSLADVYADLAKCPAGMKVLLVDACRNNPLAAAAKDLEKLDLESVTRPQAEKPPGGVAALFSCSEGQRSFESQRFKHGIFFYYVLEGLKGEAANKKGEVLLENLAGYVKGEVQDAAKDEWGPEARERPQLVGDLSGAAPLVTRRFSLGLKLVRIEPGTFTMGSPKDEEGRYDDEGPQHEVEITQPFLMGAYPVTVGQFAAFVQDSGYRTDAEKDGKGGFGFNLTTAQWEQKAEYTWRHPGFTQGDDHPVVQVSWNDATAFCAWLSQKEGKVYELPTEAEWEYACRAGTKTRFWCGDTDASLEGKVNIADTSLKGKVDSEATKTWTFVPWDDGYAFTSPVGTFKPNPWGLYDMHGNVWQWCSDWYGPYPEGYIKDTKGKESGNRRVLRGGSWFFGPRGCRSAYRSGDVPAYRDYCFGFRVVLRPPARTR